MDRVDPSGKRLHDGKQATVDGPSGKRSQRRTAHPVNGLAQMGLQANGLVDKRASSKRASGNLVHPISVAMATGLTGMGPEEVGYSCGSRLSTKSRRSEDRLRGVEVMTVSVVSKMAPKKTKTQTGRRRDSRRSTPKPRRIIRLIVVAKR